ncbi:MAG: ComEC/Rec2 family competence protein [Brevinematia bacterium]
MIYLLLTFLSLLVGSGLGIFFSTYYYPNILSLFVVKNFFYILPIVVIPFIVFVISRKNSFLMVSIILVLLFLSFSYTSIKAKQRLDNLLKVQSQDFLSGRVKISFLNKVFVETSNFNVVVYLREFDEEFTSLGSEVIVSGRARHIYHYLTNRSMFGYFLYLLGNNVPYVVYTEDDSVGEVVQSGSPFMELVNRIRQDIYRKFSIYLPHTSFISASLIIGESSDISKEFKESIRVSGISHIFSVSGFHVGIIVIAFVLLLNTLRVPRFLQFLVVSVFLVGYSLMVGLKPPVVRASVLASLILLVRAFDLSPNYLNLTLVLGIVMLVLDPFLSVDVGFILSFFAIVSMILFSRYVDDLIILLFNKVGIEPSKVVKGIVSLFSVSLTAVLFTLPVVLLWFGNSPMIGIFSSVVLVPLSSVIIVGGVLSYIISCFLPFVGEFMFRTVNFLNLVFIVITEMFSRVPLVVNISFDNLFLTAFVVSFYYFVLILLFLLVANIGRFIKV